MNIIVRNEGDCPAALRTNFRIDWFRFMLVYGVPVGIPHMFIIIPWHWDLSGILGMVALCVIVGGIFGCVITAWLGIRAVWYMVGFPISKIVAIHKRTC